MTKVIILVSMSVMALGWIGYGIWRWREMHIEKHQPELKKQKISTEKTEHLKKVKSSFDDYIKKMEKFEKKTYTKDELK